MKKTNGLLYIVLIIVMILTVSTAAADDTTPPLNPRPIEIPEHILRPWSVFGEDFPFDVDAAIAESLGDTFTPRIVGGTTVTPENKYPFMVSLQYYGNHYCGGTLIAPEWVLTAAHCWTNSAGVPYDPTIYDFAVLGEFSLSTNSGYEQRININQVWIHPSYKPTNYSNDVALLKLSSPATINAYVQTINVLDSSYELDWKSGKISGWGALAYGGSMPDTLQQANVTIFPDSECSNYTPLYDNASMVCAGTEDGSRDSCQGDSGGPLFIYSGGEWLQAGIVSWGYECAVAGYPGVYSDLTALNSWITTKMALPLPAPVTTAPASGAVFTDTLTPAMSWERSSEQPLKYQIIIRDSSNNLLSVQTTTAPTYCDSTTCNWTLVDDLPDMELKWAAKAFKVGYGWSPISDYKTFNISPHIVRTAPKSGDFISIARPLLEWRNVSWGATKYTIRVERKILGTVVDTYVYAVNTSDVCSGVNCSYRVPDDYAYPVYSWMMRAYKPSIGNTDYIGIWNMVVDSGAKRITPDKNEVVTVAHPLLKWDNIDWPEQYDIMLRDESDTTILRLQLNSADVCSGDTCEWTVQGVTLTDGVYSWYVRGLHPIYGNGRWGVKLPFTVSLP